MDIKWPSANFKRPWSELGISSFSSVIILSIYGAVKTFKHSVCVSSQVKFKETIEFFSPPCYLASLCHYQVSLTIVMAVCGLTSPSPFRGPLATASLRLSGLVSLLSRMHLLRCHSPHFSREQYWIPLIFRDCFNLFQLIYFILKESAFDKDGF